MVVFLLKFIFFIVTMISNLLSRLIFSTTAHVLVQLIQAFKVPGERAQSALEQVRNVVQGCLEYIVDLSIDVTTSFISFFFDLLKEGISSSLVAAVSAVTGLMENTRTSLDGLLKDVPEVLEAFTEMVTTIVTDLLNNCKDAIGYVTQNIA
ncbi:hypothetical protein CFP56_54666 [Olea europaea subsp. europaea]|uniref:Uncharacterized protein n=1 Tax=Olea europaea subsp. europaea TaxID=158383 RepID=A0A8S0UK06_OLEEU|nr:hypothetical protein CFP56_54666 [Olea europaea subsp. europaea]